LAPGTLDYIYAPSSDVAADARWFAETLGADVRFAIESGAVRVAMLRVGTDSPPLVLTDHLPDERAILVYSVPSLDEAGEGLRAAGWTPDVTIELPMGPATTFRAPGGQRLAIYEASRPFVVDSFVGRRDF